MASNVHSGHRERMRLRIEEGGLDKVNDHELLEYLLYHAIPQKDTNPIAHELLLKFGSLAQVMDASVALLEQVNGMTHNAALLLNSLPKVFRRYSSSRLVEKPRLNNKGKVMEYVQTLFLGMNGEALYLLMFNINGELIRCYQVNDGSASEVVAEIDKIVQNALSSKAYSVILAHNHPSGCPMPSQNDIDMTAQLQFALTIVKIKLDDHIIVGSGGAFSFEAEGLLTQVERRYEELFKSSPIRYRH